MQEHVDIKKLSSDALVKRAILSLTNGFIPPSENYSWVELAMESIDDTLEVRTYLFNKYYDELLDFAVFNEGLVEEEKK